MVYETQGQRTMTFLILFWTFKTDIAFLHEENIGTLIQLTPRYNQFGLLAPSF